VDVYVGTTVGDKLTDMVDKRLGVPDSDAVEAPLADSDSVGTPLADSDAVGTPLADSDAVEAPLADSDSVGTPVADSDSVGTPVADSDSVGTPVADSDSVGTPVADGSVEKLGRLDITPVKELKIDALFSAEKLTKGLEVSEAYADIDSDAETLLAADSEFERLANAVYVCTLDTVIDTDPDALSKGLLVAPSVGVTIALIDTVTVSEIYAVTEFEGIADTDPELLGLLETDGLVVGETVTLADLDWLGEVDSVTEILELLLGIAVRVWLIDCDPL